MLLITRPNRILVGFWSWISGLSNGHKGLSTLCTSERPCCGLMSIYNPWTKPKYQKLLWAGFSSQQAVTFKIPKLLLYKNAYVHAYIYVLSWNFLILTFNRDDFGLKYNWPLNMLMCHGHDGGYLTWICSDVAYVNFVSFEVILKMKYLWCETRYWWCQKLVIKLNLRHLTTNDDL